MGSGKSTVGSRVAARIGHRFVDLDDVIEERAGKAIQAIFEEDGEPAFRSLEGRVLRETGGRDDLVVAVGGGALARRANLEWALKHGTVVYLQVSAGELFRRLRDEAAHRPLLQDGAGAVLPDEQMARRIATMLDRREPFYRQAHVVLETDGMDVEETVDAVLSRIPS